jgi:4-amino-4-deoxy-L-arabinose transferase-like glycosyltransferase
MKSAAVRSGVLFFLTYIVLCAIVSVFPYEYYDSDSSCYSSLSQKLAFQPLAKWCAPEWWGHGGNQGLFRDHPPGILWLPAFLVRAGVKGPSAALCANFIYILFSLYFLFKLARFWGDAAFGWAAVFGFVLTPIFLQYLIRANQEHALNLAIISGIYGLARSEESFRHKGLFVLAFLFAVFIKGLSALILTLLAIIYWIVILRNRKPLFLIAGAHLLALVATLLFELWYRGVTGTSFWAAYLAFQGGRSLGSLLSPLGKIYNFLWYDARALWFAAPWIILGIWSLFKSRKEKLGVFKDPFSRFLVFGSLAIMVSFSLADRKADRYIFPAYGLLVLASVRIFSNIKPGFLSWVRRQEQRLPIVLCILLIVFSFLRVFFHSFLYHFIRFWPG